MPIFSIKQFRLLSCCAREIAPEERKVSTVRDGHALSHRVRRAILDAIPEVTDVVIHVEPFNGGPLP